MGLLTREEKAEWEELAEAERPLYRAKEDIRKRRNAILNNVFGRVLREGKWEWASEERLRPASDKDNQKLARLVMEAAELGWHGNLFLVAGERGSTFSVVLDMWCDDGDLTLSCHAASPEALTAGAKTLEIDVDLRPWLRELLAEKEQSLRAEIALKEEELQRVRESLRNLEAS